MLAGGVHLGYRRSGAHGGAWIARAYDPATRKRVYLALGPADDALDADGERVLSFAQAQTKCRAWHTRAFRGDDEPVGGSGLSTSRPKTVGDAMHAYLEWLADHRKSTTAVATRSAAQTHVLPALGHLRLEALTSAHIKRWHGALAKAPARLRTRRGAVELRLREAKDEDSKRARRIGS
jgi:hypothetical protein